MKHSSQPEYEVSGDLAEVETIDLLALIPPTLDGMTKALFVDLITRLAAIEERDREREEKLAAVEEEVSALREDNARKDERIAELERELFNHSLHGHPDMRLDIDALQGSPAPGPSSYPTPSGRKTAARIEDLKSRLKRRRGRATFTEIREEMGLSKSQFSKLAGRLDKRIFDIQRHPTKAREKLLILRQQIGS